MFNATIKLIRPFNRNNFQAQLLKCYENCISYAYLRRRLIKIILLVEKVMIIQFLSLPTRMKWTFTQTVTDLWLPEVTFTPQTYSNLIHQPKSFQDHRQQPQRDNCHLRMISWHYMTRNTSTNFLVWMDIDNFWMHENAFLIWNSPEL